MHSGKYVFSQVMDFVSWRQFDSCVKRYDGHYRTRKFRCWDQFLAMAFGQLAFRESLRDIVVCLNSHKDTQYHLGLRCTLARSMLATANEKRDWRIYGDLAKLLTTESKKLYIENVEFTEELHSSIYVLDATVIDLCLNQLIPREFVPK